jgi:mycothiol system anti-sigma-R factor
VLTSDAGEPVGREVCCADVQREVFAACDGELSSAAAVVLDQHLSVCATCRARVAADAVFHRVVRAAATRDVAPATLRERIALLLHATATENASA